MTKREEFIDYLDVIESMYDAKIRWVSKNLVVVTLEYGGLALSRMFNAREAEFAPMSGSTYADRLFKNMYKEFDEELRIHGVY